MQNRRKEQSTPHSQRKKGPATPVPFGRVTLVQDADEDVSRAETGGENGDPLEGSDEFSAGDFAGIETATERESDSLETLPELEREIGIADWIDPETGEPAEGQSPPHLNVD